jgi:two-component system nitrate/nitrite response regulator NarL
VGNPDQVVEGSQVRTAVRVLVVQDHPLLAAAIREFLEAEPDLVVCGVERTGQGAIAAAAREKPDVVLMDHLLPDVDGPAAAAVIQGLLPEVAIVFHSAEDTEDALLDAVDSGATAYLTRGATAEDVVDAVRRVGHGEVLIPTDFYAKAIQRRRIAASRQTAQAELAGRFTRRELEVLALLARGLETTAIADQLGIADHTVEWHLRHLIEKLHVHSKLQAVVEAARQGLVQL